MKRNFFWGIVVGLCGLPAVFFLAFRDECPQESPFAPDETILFSAVLRNIEPILPEFKVEIEKLARCLQRTGNKFVVSIFSNNNTDARTAVELASLRSYLQAENRTWFTHIETNGFIPDEFSSYRIAKLAFARNQALDGIPPSIWAGIHRVVFSCDVLFSVWDIYRLARTYRLLNAHIVCSTDWYFTFYDGWVSRDQFGGRVAEVTPFVLGGDGTSPFPARSCWNGLLLVDAQPLRTKQVQFRSQPRRNGECGNNAETLFFCLDYVDLGLDRIFVDPSVRVFYGKVYYWYHILVLPLVNWFRVADFQRVTKVSQEPSCALENVPVVVLKTRLIFGAAILGAGMGLLLQKWKRRMKKYDAKRMVVV